MLVVRAYGVMDSVAVEISCVHGSGPEGAHLLYREQVITLDGGLIAVLGAAEDALRRAGYLVHRGDLEETDDCALA